MPKKWQLRINGLTAKDEGQYTCVVSNGYGTLRHTFHIEALEFLNHKPILVDSTPSKTVMVNMAAEFRCDFKADLAFIVHWLRPAEHLRERGEVDDFDKNNKSNFEVVTYENGKPVMGNTLRINRTSLRDAGYYYCAAKTNLDMEVGELHLTVLEPGEAVLEAPQNISVPEGQPAVFSCRTNLELHRHTSWVRLFDNDIEELSVGTEVFKIDNVTAEDSGMYACVVGSDTAHLEHVASLTVLPDAVVTSPTVARAHYRMSVFAGVISLVAALLFVMSIVIFKRFKDERDQKQLAISNAKRITQWTKKVIIERQDAGGYGTDAPITAPVIHIVKQCSNRSRLGSENTTLTTVSEYELPLDPEWEFPRSDLVLSSVLGEGAFGKVGKIPVCSLTKHFKFSEHQNPSISEFLYNHSINSRPLIAILDLVD